METLFLWYLRVIGLDVGGHATIWGIDLRFMALSALLISLICKIKLTASETAQPQSDFNCTALIPVYQQS